MKQIHNFKPQTLNQSLSKLEQITKSMAHDLNITKITLRSNGFDLTMSAMGTVEELIIDESWANRELNELAPALIQFLNEVNDLANTHRVRINDKYAKELNK